MDALYTHRSRVKRLWRLRAAPALLALGLFAACADLPPLPATMVHSRTTSPTAVYGAVTPIVRTTTPQPPSLVETPCAYTWASQELPDLSTALRAAFLEAGLPEVEARAAAFGETCSGAGIDARFLAMQTDFYITVDTAREDPAEMGALAEKILAVLEHFPPEATPGPNLGYAGIRYRLPDREVNLWFPLERAEALLQEGKRGADLFQALREE